MVEFVGYLAAILGTLSWVPQVHKAWISRETKSLSLATNLLLFITMSLWLIYGLLLGAWPLILANVVALLLVGSIVVAKLIYK